MSHPRDIKLKLLELAKPANQAPDVRLWIERAKELEAYVFSGGNSDTDPPDAERGLPKPGYPQSRGPARK